MLLQERIDILVQLGETLRANSFEEIQQKAQLENPWFTVENQNFMLELWRNHYLTAPALLSWIKTYSISDKPLSKNIGLVLAGNIPFVGFHDVISTFIAGHTCQIKLSDKDKIWIPFFLETLEQINPESTNYFTLVDRLKSYDAVIATGSNNSANLFESYFKHVPNIIRKNRNGVAVLTGNESNEDLQNLTKDIFLFFGLGCRNVSKLYVPIGYDFTSLLEACNSWNSISFHNKYKNNLDYNQALYLLNKQDFLQHEIILLIESPSIASRVGSLHYEYYEHPDQLPSMIQKQTHEIQCIVGKQWADSNVELFDFGQAQTPPLHAYADGVDTMRFLTNLK